jgi:competence protein ComGC
VSRIIVLRKVSISKMVQAQVQSYIIDKNKVPTMAELVTAEYLMEDTGCPNGTKNVQIDSEGKVTAVAKPTT